MKLYINVQCKLNGIQIKFDFEIISLCFSFVLPLFLIYIVREILQLYSMCVRTIYLLKYSYEFGIFRMILQLTGESVESNQNQVKVERVQDTRGMQKHIYINIYSILQ